MASARNILSTILADNRLGKAEFTKLRRQIFEDGHIGIEEADMIFEVDTKATDLPEGWNEFFINAITDFLIRQTLPVGYVSPIHATWLMERIEQDEQMTEETEQELLLSVLRLAEDCPANLEVYALDKIRSKIVNRAVAGRLCLTEGDVSMIKKVMYASNVKDEVDDQISLSVSEDDVNLIKRVVYATGGHGGFGITKEEAAFLFELDETTQDVECHESWQKLFVGAIANHLMTMGAPKPVDRDDYKRAQEFLQSDTTIKWGEMRKVRLNNIKTTIWDKLLWKPEQSQFNDQDRMNQAERIDLTEAKWLIDHLNRDGQISENEKALLRFIKEECPHVHVSLEPLLKKVA